VSDLLETIELDEGPCAAAPLQRRSTRWLWVVARAAALGFVLAVPVRLTFARNEVLRLESQWHDARAIDSARLAVAAALADNASPADADRVAAGNHAAKQEAIVALRQLSKTAGRDIVVDPQVRRLRQAVVTATALYSEVVELGRVGGFEKWDRFRELQVSADRADQLLAGQLRRFSLRPAAHLPGHHLASVDPILASLRRVVDQPLPGRLVASSPAGLEAVDLTHNTVSAIRLRGLPRMPVDRIVPRQGWVAVVVAIGNGVEQLYAAPPSLSGAVRPLTLLANVPAVFPAARPDTVWVELTDGRVEEVDGRGVAVTGPVALAAHTRMVGVVDAGLVLATTGRRSRVSEFSLRHPVVTVWDPVWRQDVRAIGPGALFVSGAGQDTVAWVTPGDALRFTSVSTGAVVTVPLPTGGLPGGAIGTLSPDGRYFASTFIEMSSGRPIPAVIDTRTGAVREPRRSGELFDIGGFLWFPTSDGLYLNASRGSEGGHDAMVWPIGGDDVSYLRLGGGSVEVLAVA
jgi:hypothetical protein